MTNRPLHYIMYTLDITGEIFMKSLHIGMFVEINKNRLSSEDMTRAISALEDSSDEKVYSLLFRKTKNPSTTFKQTCHV